MVVTWCDVVIRVMVHDDVVDRAMFVKVVFPGPRACHAIVYNINYRCDAIQDTLQHAVRT